MFESILRDKRPLRRLGRGAAASLLVHTVALGLVVSISLHLSRRSARRAAAHVTFVEARAAPAPPPPPPPPRARRSTVRRTPRPVVVPDDPQTMVKAKEEKVSQAERSTEEKKEEGDDGGEEGGQPGGVPGGVSGGVPGGQLGGQLGGKVGGQGTRAVLPFGAGMTRPQRISGRDPVYSKEALAARVEGLMIVRCTITVEGRLDRCRVIKTLPFMERAVLDALATHRYTPVMFQGQPVSVQYVFNIKLVMP